MNLESIRDYCLSLPYATEDMPFGDDYVIFRIFGKIFGCIALNRPDYFTVKCNADYAIKLRETHIEIEPAWHWNKKYWNQIRLDGTLSDSFIQSLISHSYSEVVAKLSKKLRTEYPEITKVI